MPAPQIHGPKFEDMILRRGRPVEWREAVVCPCWNMDSGQPNYECPACKGIGFRYGTPYQSIALVMSMANTKEWEDSAGVFEVGDAIMTVPKWIPQPNTETGLLDKTMKNALDNEMYDIGIYDLITLLDDEYKSYEVLVKGEPIYMRPADTLINEIVTRVKYVESIDDVTGAVTRYKKGIDYQMNKNHLEWLTNALENGRKYSVVYYHRPVYTVFANLPNSRQQDKQDLPHKVAIRYRAGGIQKS